MIINRKEIIDYIFIILLLLNGGTVIKVIGFTAEFQVFTLLVMFICLFINRRLFIKKTLNTIVLLTLIFSTISLVHFFKFNLDYFLNVQVLNFIILIIIGVFIGNQFLNRHQIFILKLEKILKILIIHAILSCLVLTFFPSKNVLFYDEDQSTAYIGYFNIFFQRTNILYSGVLDDSMKNFLNFNFYRAHGVFWEAGVFGVFLNLFVFINLFIFKKIKSLRYAIPAAILSWSTATLIVFVFQMIIFVFSKQKKNRTKIFSRVIILVSLFFVTPAMIDNYKNKISGLDRGSAAQRLSDTMGAINVIFNNPLTGIGVDFKNFKEQMSDVKLSFSNEIKSNFDSRLKYEVKFSNSFLRLFVYFGILIGLFLCYCFYKQNLIPYNRWLFFIITMVSLSTSPILFLSFYFSFFISGLRNVIPFLKINMKNTNLKNV